MAVSRQKTVIEFKVAGVAETHARTKLACRDLASVIDEPVARGGTNGGFTPTETIVAALIGCTNVIASRISEKMGLHVEGMAIDATAQFDRRGVMLEEELAVPFPEITLNISCRTNASAAQIEQWKSDLAKYCPIAKVIRRSGTTITEHWSISPL